jgi:hypothetical protein
VLRGKHQSDSVNKDADISTRSGALRKMMDTGIIYKREREKVMPVFFLGLSEVEACMIGGQDTPNERWKRSRRDR